MAQETGLLERAIATAIADKQPALIRLGSGQEIAGHIEETDGQSIRIRGRHGNQVRVVRIARIEAITAHEIDSGSETVSGGTPEQAEGV